MAVEEDGAKEMDIAAHEALWDESRQLKFEASLKLPPTIASRPVVTLSFLDLCRDT